MRFGSGVMLRLVTSFLVLALASVCLFEGWEVARFAFADSRSSAASDRGQSYETWTDTPGVSARALEALLLRAGKSNDAFATAVARRDILARFLSIRPLSSAGWLLLAENKLSTGQSVDKVRGSLSMSEITGPHEGTVMLDRAVFGFANWRLLSPELQRRTVNDLAETMPMMGYLNKAGPQSRSWRPA
jgi:hypothetical protein